MFASDMIAMTHRMLKNAGLEREDGGFLGVANTFHGMSSEVSTLMGGPFKCSDLRYLKNWAARTVRKAGDALS